MAASTTAKAFNEFHDRIRLTDNQKQTVQARRSNVNGYLTSAFGSSSDMPLVRSWVIGSGQRDTMIRPLNDIDMMAHFSNSGEVYERYKSDSRLFLYRVRDALKRESTVKVVGARGQAVRFFYTDDLHVDVVPVIKWSSGGYALPSGNGKWLTTDPDFHHEYLKTKSKEVGGDLKQFSRAMKQWNRAHGSRLKSFHLEMLAANVFSTLGNNSRTASQVFFANAKNGLTINDPAGHSGDLSSYLDSSWSQRRQVVANMEEAEERAKRANDAEAKGNHKEAIRLWRLVFGDEFPAYG